MIISFAAGYERGHCEYCRDVYDTRDDLDCGSGVCGRCARNRWPSQLVYKVAYNLPRTFREKPVISVY